MNNLKELNKYVLDIDGTATEFTQFHLSALKAAVAITECKPCDDEMLLELIATHPEKFGVCESSVEYRGGSILPTCLDNDNDQFNILHKEYELMVGYTKKFDGWVVTGQGVIHEFDKNKNIAVFNVISRLPKEALDI